VKLQIRPILNTQITHDRKSASKMEEEKTRTTTNRDTTPVYRV